MKRFAAVLIAVALAADAFAAGAPKPAAPAHLTTARADSIRAAIAKDRTDTQDWLKTSPASYLATILRRDFESKTTMTVGRDRDNDLRIDDASIQPHHLRVTVVGDSFRVVAVDPGASFKVKDAEMRGATLGPSAIGVSRYTIRLSHQRYPALIVFDPQSPRYADYKGLQYFPVDLAYYYELPLTRNPKPDTLIILSTRGNQRNALRVGWFDFTVQGKPCRLEATRLLEPGVDENDMGIFFRDATTGKDTYGVGRYLDATALPDGRYALDFNMAYNPACAVSEHYNCPIPPRANALKVAIRAGEKDPHYLH